MGMAVFTDHFIEAFGLSRTELSMAYLLGTLGSSFFLTRAGRFYDETGARVSIVASSIALGLFVSYIACIDHVARFLGRAAEISPAAVTFPLALVSVTANLGSSWLSDRTRLKYLLVVKLAAFILGAWGLLHLQQQSGYWTMVAGFGVCGGIWAALSNLAYIRFFGRQHLGQISGLSMSLIVFGSAVGPALFSLGFDEFGTYHVAVWLSLAVLVALLIAAVIIPQDEPVPPVQGPPGGLP